MSKQRDPDDEDDDEDEYDEEEEEEEDFIPGMDDDDDDDDEQDEEVKNTIACVLKLNKDDDGPHLQINGDGVRLSGAWVEEGNCTFSGTLEPVASPKKAPPRTFTGKITAKRSKDATVYSLEAFDSSMQFNLEFGSLTEPTASTIDWTRISAPPVAAAAAASVPRDSDDDEVADEHFDYSELVALHEDAGRPVQAVLQQSYEDEPPSKRARHDDDDEDDVEF